MRDSLALVGRGLKRIWENTSGLKSQRDKVAWEIKSLTNLPNNLVTKYEVFIFVLQASGHAARCTTLVLKEDVYFGSSRKDAVLMCPTR